MIIAEGRVKVPGKKYKTKVSCVSTRRLTTIEWILLSCVNNLSKKSDSGFKVKEVFEKIFQFQNSELLIIPCLKNLEALKVITIKLGNDYSYSNLLLSDIVLTELGKSMLKDGLLPGEQREIALDVYYNPLTGKITTSDWFNGESEKVIDFGTESDYNLSFPEERIVNGLQSGAVASGKFTAAKFRIENIENLVETDWETYTDIEVELEKSGEINTIPELLEENVFYKVSDVLRSKDISEKMRDSLCALDKVPLYSMKGSGANIKDYVQDICKNSKIIFIHEILFNAYKKNTTFFKNKEVVIFGKNQNVESSVKEGKKEITNIFYLKEDFPIEGVLLINEKEESLSLCKAKWVFKGIDIKAPVAIVDTRMLPQNKMLANWVEGLVVDNLKTKSEYLSLAFLLEDKLNKKKIVKSLENLWKDYSLKEIISFVEKVNKESEQLSTKLINMFSELKILEDKIEYANTDLALKQLSEVIDAGLLSTKSKTYLAITEKIIKKKGKLKNYLELFELVQKFRISSSDEVKEVFGSEEDVFSNEIVEDLINLLVKDESTKLPRYFEWEIFFNDYMDCLRYIEAHIDGLNIFEKATKEKLQRSIEVCPNLSSLQMYVSELLTKNAYLMDHDINIYSSIKKADANKADSYFDNIKNIEESLKATIDSEYKNVESKEERKVYVIDTCALIHRPEILRFFDDEEYVRIPTKVIDEIGKIKDHRSDKYGEETSAVARRLAREINEEYLSLFNVNNKIRLMIENSDTSLLPADLDPNVPDNQILSVALKYSDCDTTIVSDDNVFRLASGAQNIKTMTSEEFIETHKDNSKSLDEWKRTVKNPLPVLKPNTVSQSKTDGIFTGKIENEVKETKTINKIQDSNSIDDLPVKELAKYTNNITAPVLSFLDLNSVKTIGQFRALTPEKVDRFRCKGSQVIYKNTVKSTLSRIDNIILKMKENY